MKTHLCHLCFLPPRAQSGRRQRRTQFCVTDLQEVAASRGHHIFVSPFRPQKFLEVVAAPANTFLCLNFLRWHLLSDTLTNHSVLSHPSKAGFIWFSPIWVWGAKGVCPKGSTHNLLMEFFTPRTSCSFSLYAPQNRSFRNFINWQKVASTPPLPHRRFSLLLLG